MSLDVERPPALWGACSSPATDVRLSAQPCLQEPALPHSVSSLPANLPTPYIMLSSFYTPELAPLSPRAGSPSPPGTELNSRASTHICKLSCLCSMEISCDYLLMGHYSSSCFCSGLFLEPRGMHSAQFDGIHGRTCTAKLWCLQSSTPYNSSERKWR